MEGDTDALKSLSSVLSADPTDKGHVKALNDLTVAPLRIPRFCSLISFNGISKIFKNLFFFLIQNPQE
jgi:hypothetical protein